VNVCYHYIIYRKKNTVQKHRGIFILDPGYLGLIYSQNHQALIRRMVEIYDPPQSAMSILRNLDQLKDIEMVFSGWGAPVFSEELLEAAPLLKIVFYGAGSIRGIVTDGFWQRKIRIVSAWGANAVPVVEYTLAQIILCLKKAYFHARITKENRTWQRIEVSGAYQSTIGIISLGMIGRMLVEKLRTYDLHILAHDPFVNPSDARQLGVELVSLENLFKLSDVVSLHTPWLPETEGMIQGKHFRLMKPGAAFINTARGAVVVEPELVEVLSERPDLFAVLDVTHPEPPEADSKLFDLTNVFLTPHIAGSMDRECWRMGQVVIDELSRYLEGKPLMYEITQERAKYLA
jgi:phosphoglycerate dehydrogenase-like enzyme